MGNSVTTYMGNTTGIYATTCNKCKKVYVFGKVKEHGDFWKHWRLHKKLFLESHKCEFTSFTVEDFSRPVIIKEIFINTNSYVKDPNLRAQIIAMEEFYTIKQLKNFTIEYIDKEYPQKRILCKYDLLGKWGGIPTKLRREIQNKIDYIFDDDQENIDAQIFSYQKSLEIGCVKSPILIGATIAQQPCF